MSDWTDLGRPSKLRERRRFSGLTRTTDAAVEPVTRQEMKDFLKLDVNDEDPLVTSLITAARLACENYCKRSFATQTWVLTLDDQVEDYDIVVLPRPNLLSVTSVKYYDSSDVQQTLATTFYNLDTNGNLGRIVFTSSIPDTSTTRKPSWEITYTAGFGAAATDIPEDIKLAIKLTVADYYQYRGTQVSSTIRSTIPNHIEAMLDPHKIMMIA